MASFQTQSIVLRRTNYGEADRIFTFITPTRGKVDAIARGVRKSKSKLAGALEPFCLSEIGIHEGKKLGILTSARIERRFDSLLRDYERMKRAHLMLEMAHVLTDTDTSSELFYLLTWGLSSLCQDQLSPSEVELRFKLQLLDELGHIPDTKVPEAPWYRLEYGEGVFVAQQQKGVHSISFDELKLWRYILREGYGAKPVAGAQTLAQNSLLELDAFYRYTFDRRFKSESL